MILIAVALFAALSYALTNSGRGNGDIDKENAEIMVGQIMGTIGSMQQGFMRLDISGGYDQILFDDSAETASGTCYDNNSTTSPCNTIGLFNSDTGVPKPFLKDEYHYTGVLSWGFITTQTQLSGTELGTTAADDILRLSYMPKTLCEALNKKLNGSATIGSVSSYAAGTGWSEAWMLEDETFGLYLGPTDSGMALDNEGCVTFDGGNNFDFYYVFKER